MYTIAVVPLSTSLSTFSVPPQPATMSFTWFGVYCATSHPAAAAYPTYSCESGFVRLPHDLAQSKTYSLIGVDRTYTDVLPSMNLAFQLPNEHTVRVGLAEQVARPRRISCRLE